MKWSKENDTFNKISLIDSLAAEYLRLLYAENLYKKNSHDLYIIQEICLFFMLWICHFSEEFFILLSW